VFTGIIETMAEVAQLDKVKKNLHICFNSSISGELHVDQSIAHNGVCLTVTEVDGDTYKVTAIDETLKRSNIGQWSVGDHVNIERAMPANARLDGHIVQGHVDATAVCMAVAELDGSWSFKFEVSESHKNLIVEKGSIAANGVSLTITEANENDFSVAIVPYTFENTNFKSIKEGSIVNIEFDIIGKYVAKQTEVYR